MSKTALTSQNAPRPAGAYSQGIVANGFLYTAGFGPQDPVTGEFAADDIRAQVQQVLRNIEAILRVRGLGLGDVVKATVHLQDLHRDFADFNEAYLELMPQPYPVRTTVGSDLAGILVEIDVVAALPGHE